MCVINHKMRRSSSHGWVKNPQCSIPNIMDKGSHHINVRYFLSWLHINIKNNLSYHFLEKRYPLVNLQWYKLSSYPLKSWSICFLPCKYYLNLLCDQYILLDILRYNYSYNNHFVQYSEMQWCLIVCKLHDCCCDCLQLHRKNLFQ